MSEEPVAVVSKELTFAHAGDSGDLVYSLPVIDALAKGRASQLFINQSHYTRVKANQNSVDLIKPLLAATRPWLEVSLHHGELVRYNLNRWRDRPASYSKLTRTLAECHAMAFGFGMELFRQPWITLKAGSLMADRAAESALHYPVVIHRSARYQNPWFPWKSILDRYDDAIIMVGLKEEHEAFCEEFSVEIPHIITKDFLELAHVINAAKLFIGNQSSPFALAEAMKKPVIQEVCLAIKGQGNPNCLFPRRWAQHVATENWTPWDLASLPEHNLTYA